MKCLITDRFSSDALSRLRTTAGFSVDTSTSLQPTPLELATCEILIVRSRTSVNATLLSHAPKLKLVITATSGYDHIDFSALKARDVIALNTPESNAASACELTWSLVLGVSRKILDSHRAVKSGEWRTTALTGLELAGKTYGIVGLGRIGARVAQVAHAFGMKIIAYDPFQEESEFKKAHAERLSLDELCRRADVLSLHVPLTVNTRKMIAANQLDCLPPHAILVNTSRGECIDEQALIKCLEAQKMGGAGLDVFAKEPLDRNSGLLRLPNVLLTPHVGAWTQAAFAQASMEAAEKAIAYAERGVLSDVLPPPEEWFRPQFND